MSGLANALSSVKNLYFFPLDFIRSSGKWSSISNCLFCSKLWFFANCRGLKSPPTKNCVASRKSLLSLSIYFRSCNVSSSCLILSVCCFCLYSSVRTYWWEIPNSSRLFISYLSIFGFLFDKSTWIIGSWNVWLLFCLDFESAELSPLIWINGYLVLCRLYDRYFDEFWSLIWFSLIYYLYFIWEHKLILKRQERRFIRMCW